MYLVSLVEGGPYPKIVEPLRAEDPSISPPSPRLSLSLALATFNLPLLSSRVQSSGRSWSELIRSRRRFFRQFVIRGGGRERRHRQIRHLEVDLAILVVGLIWWIFMFETWLCPHTTYGSFTNKACVNRNVPKTEMVEKSPCNLLMCVAICYPSGDVCFATNMRRLR